MSTCLRSYAAYIKIQPSKTELGFLRSFIAVSNEASLNVRPSKLHFWQWKTLTSRFDSEWLDMGSTLAIVATRIPALHDEKKPISMMPVAIYTVLNYIDFVQVIQKIA